MVSLTKCFKSSWSLLIRAVQPRQEFLLSLYLGKSTLTSVYGAAGSLLVILVWVYYSSQILLFGAEFTRLYAFKCGSYVRPEEGAHFVRVHEAEAPDIAGPPEKPEAAEQRRAA